MYLDHPTTNNRLEGRWSKNRKFIAGSQVFLSFFIGLYQRVFFLTYYQSEERIT
jgi:hypothetical protein